MRRRVKLYHRGSFGAQHAQSPRSGVLQADPYQAHRLFDEADPEHPIGEAACWAHVGGRLYDIETHIRGRLPDHWLVRNARAGPKLEVLNKWLIATPRKLPKKSELACSSTRSSAGQRSYAI